MTYDYVCMSCAHVWEAEQRITEEPLKDCPHCHDQAAKRLISGGQGFILKGGGWYSDLYSSAKPAAAKSEGASESKSETKSESTKSESSASSCAGGACATAACPATAAN